MFGGRLVGSSEEPAPREEKKIFENFESGNQNSTSSFDCPALTLSGIMMDPETDDLNSSEAMDIELTTDSFENIALMQSTPIETIEHENEETVEDLLRALGITKLTARCDETEKKFNDIYESLHHSSREVEPLLDEGERMLKLYNQIALTPYQPVVMKTVEFDEDGVMKTVIASHEESEEESDTNVKEESPTVSMDTDNSTVKPEDHISDDEDVAEIKDVTPEGNIEKEETPLMLAPTPRILPRMIPAVNKRVYAMKGNALTPWFPARVMQIQRNVASFQLEFKIQLEPTPGRKTPPGTQIRIMTAKHLAFSSKTPFILPVGARVIGRFKDETKPKSPYGNEFYAGIIAERPIPHNRNRYLLFFDDGFAQYVSIEDVLWVCESSKDVWNDVHPNSQQFIKEYLQKYPERPMVRLSQGTIVSTEWNGNWWIARVVEVDCSLVKMHFEADNRYEWIYRGSTRLAPLFNKLKRLQALGTANPSITKNKSPNSIRRRHDIHAAAHIKEARIEYLSGKDSIAQTARKSTSTPTNTNTRVPSPEPSAFPSRGVNANSFRSLNSKKAPVVTSSTGFFEYEGRMTKVNIPIHPARVRQPSSHNCSPKCVIPYDEDDPRIRSINPLTLPMHFGWEREVAKSQRRVVYYRSPCGRRLRNLKDLHSYLIQTQSTMPVDHFCFDLAVDCFNEFVPTANHFLINDITYSREKCPVQCCNTIDHEYPEYVEYSKDRIAGKGVHINLDTEFLSCCDCKDDCSNKAKCACWRMTMEGLNVGKDEPVTDGGYKYRRLMEHCITGVYECNSGCSCRKTCLNRVVQYDMKWHLQIFKTSNKGWGIRPIHDIPQGSFICVYAGQLLTESGANEDGKAFGDEYLAELDYIEVSEAYKEGFEPEVVEPDSKNGRRRFSGDYMEDDLMDGDYMVANAHQNKTGNDQAKYSLRDKKVEDKENKSARALKRKSTREYFGTDEYCYIMDAKSMGNIGRYLNHSCQPNVFVQNVFVDTHDLRFPWVAFFASKHIRAGTELTWDYNYDIGSVPGKTMYCYCGTPECRGRLL